MNKIVLRVLLAIVSAVVFFAIAEGLYRWLGPEPITSSNLHARFRLYYQDAERRELAPEDAVARGLIVPDPTMPRSRRIWAPDKTFYICYTGARQDYFDAHGCVEVRINSRQIREREQLCAPKPKGQRRVVCIGDSFTFGWGVRVEDAWPRRVEAALRARDDKIRTVNCGASGATVADEYGIALRERFHRFEPDVVVVALCLNDLLPTSSALSHQEPEPWLLRRSRILGDLFQGYALEAQLSIDPERDLVQELLDIPADDIYYEVVQWLKPGGVDRAALWPGGGPQRALRAMRDWCRERDVLFAVVLWPLFQGLGADEHYPFAKMHELVATFCVREEVPFLDLLPTFVGHETPSLWVTPADYHGNNKAQELATEPIARFLGRLLEL